MSCNLVHSNYHKSTQSFQWLYKICFQAPRAGHLACFQFFTTISKAVRISAPHYLVTQISSLCSASLFFFQSPFKVPETCCSLLRRGHCPGVAVCWSPLPLPLVSPSQTLPGTTGDSPELLKWQNPSSAQRLVLVSGLLGKENRILSQF